MRHTTLLRAVIAGLALLGLNPALAGDISAGNLIIENPWSRATPKGAKVGAGYLGLINIGTNDDRLVSATSDVSERVEIHTMTMEAGVMKMRRLPDGLPVKARSTVTLKPGGYHLMFIDLKAPLEKDQDFNVTLTFEKTGDIDVLFKTTGIGGQSPYPKDDAAGGSASGSASGHSQGSGAGTEQHGSGSGKSN